jgi:SAM-dependent methyltransferase
VLDLALHANDHGRQPDDPGAVFGTRFQVGRPCDACAVARTFEELVDEAASADVSGWDFSWLDGRATEQRPSWGYQRLLARRLRSVAAALDVQTGGGEILDGVADFPPTMAATESWPPNVAIATERLHRRGVVVVAHDDQSPLPFADAAFDLVCSRHPAQVRWSEIARVLRPGGDYFAQHVGPRSNVELSEFFLGPQPPGPHSRDPSVEAAAARRAGLAVDEMRLERLRVEFFDVGAVVYFLRKVIWTVPDFRVGRYLDRLRMLHEHIAREGRFVAHSSRVLVQARKPI